MILWGDNILFSDRYKYRNSNWELLRIISMLAIVAGHCFAQSNASRYFVGSNWVLGNFIGSGSRIAVSMFLFLGTWYMVDAKFSASRILKLWGEVFFYTVIITLLIKLVGFQVSIKLIIKSFLPFYGRPLWFASTYLALMLVSPFLQKILTWPRVVLKRLLIVLGLILIIPSTFSLEMMDQWLCSVVWFMFVFLFMGYYKHYLASYITIGKFKLLFIGLFMYCILVSCNIFCIYYQNHGVVILKVFSKIIENYLGDYKSLPNILIALPLFIFFQKLDIGKLKLINYIGSAAFSVYIIHQVPAIIPYIWKDVFYASYWLHSSYGIIYMCLVIIIIYVGSLFVDRIRVNFIEYLWVHSKVFSFLEDKINKFYQIVG